MAAMRIEATYISVAEAMVAIDCGLVPDTGGVYVENTCQRQRLESSVTDVYDIACVV